VSAEVVKSGIDDAGIKQAIELAQQGDAAIGTFTKSVSGASPEIQAYAQKVISLSKVYLDLIKNLNRTDEANKNAVDSIRAGAAAVAEEQRKLASTRAAQARFPSDFEEVRRQATRSFGGGKLPQFATAADTHKLNQQFGQIASSISAGTLSLRQFEQELALIAGKKIVPPSASAEVNELRNSLAALGATFATADNRANSFKKAIVNATTATRLLVVSNLYVFFSKLRETIGQSISDFNSLSVQISQIQAITQDLPSTTREWAESLREVSDATGANLTDVSVAAYEALSNQITKSKEDTQEFLNTALELARTVGATPSEAVNLLSSSINAFGLAASDARRLSAEFFAVIDIGRIRAQDLQNIYGRAAIAGAKLGATTTEMGAALAVLTQNGLTTEDAVTRLNNLFVKLINPTTEMQALFKQFGVTSGAQLVGLNGFAGAMQAIEAAIKNGNTELENLFPEIRTLVGFLGLSGQNAVKFSNAIDQVSNSMDRFNEASRLTKIPIGQQIKEEMEKIKNVFTVDFAQDFQQLISNFLNNVGSVGEGLKAWKDAIEGVGKVVLQVSIAFGVFKGIKILVNGVTAAFTALNLSLNILENQTKLATAAQAALNASFLKNPFVLAFVGGAAAVEIFLLSLKRVSNGLKESVEQAKKLGQIQFKEINVKSQIRVESASNLFNTVKNDLSSSFTTAFQRINIAFGDMIKQQEAEVKALSRLVERSFR
jgi:TP901 family phage tail tape measure protein